jgi:hypothetical protein
MSQANNIVPFISKLKIIEDVPMNELEILEDNATEATSDLLQLLEYFGYEITNEHDMGLLYHVIRASMMRLAEIPHPLHEVADLMIKIVDD